MKLKYLRKLTPAFWASIGLFINLITIEYFASPIYTLLQYMTLLPVILYCIINIRKVPFFQWPILFAVSLLSFFIVISSCFNSVETYYIRAAVYEGVLYFLFFIFCILLVKNEEFKILGLAGKCYLIVVILINDLLMLMLPNTFYNISGRDIGTCFIGNKFSVAYAHLMLFFLLIFLEKKKRKRTQKIVLYALIMSALCILIECVTVMLAVWLVVLIYFLNPLFSKILSNAVIFAGCFFTSAFFLILFNEILSLNIVQFFLVNILHRDATLTGRLEIYPYIFRALSSHQWLGYGYGTSIIKDISTWYANAQNAFWDFVIRYGIITMATLIFLLLLIIHKYHKVQLKIGYNKTLCLLLSIIYVYMFMGMVEIVYNKHFFFYMAFFNAYILYCHQKGREYIHECK